MQEQNAPDASAFPSVLAAVHDHRIRRYMPAAGSDMSFAFRIYVWNCAISEAFYPSLHYAEIICRNAIHKVLLFRGKEHWFVDSTFVGILDHKYARELRNVVDEEKEKHGDKFTCHHVVSALTFGFWEHLTTKRFQRYLWPKGIGFSFPGRPLGKGREDLHALIESVRRWRNRIAHHEAVFDKGPTKKHQDALELISWACPQTAAWVTSISRVPAVINIRPDAQEMTVTGAMPAAQQSAASDDMATRTLEGEATVLDASAANQCSGDCALTEGADSSRR